MAAFSFVTQTSVQAGADEVARAVAVVQRVVELNTQFAAYNVELAAPDPVVGSGGKFMLPVTGEGQLTEWAEKALSA